MTQARIPPNSKESEMMVLGCMLTSDSSLSIAAEDLTDAHFYYNEHQIIFSALRAAYRSDRPGDIHLIGEELKRQNKLEAVGGINYLATLAQYAGTSAYIEEYINDLRKLSQARQTIDWAHRTVRDVLERPQDISVLLPRKIDDLKHIAEAAPGINEGTSIGEILSGKKSNGFSLIDRIAVRKLHYEETGEPYINGQPTGFEDLDNHATVLIDTNLVIIGGRPAMGKTAFALNIGLNVAGSRHQPLPIAIISLEMGIDQLVERFLSTKSAIPGDKIQKGVLTNKEMDKLRGVVQQLQDQKIYLYDEQCNTIEQVSNLARKAKGRHGIRLLIVDYLQLLGSSGSRDSRQYEVADISRKLKLLAIELKIPIICLSQLSRKVEERPGHRPMMSDLRDSGQVEQDADVVIFLCRRDYYDPNDKPGLVDVIIAKNRHGTIGDVTMKFNKECGAFANWTSHELPKDKSNSTTDSLFNLSDYK